MTIVKDIKESLTPIFEKYRGLVVFAYLFGSAALKETTPLSDIDIAVYFGDVKERALFDLKFSFQADVCRALKRSDVDVLVLNTARNIVVLDEIIRKGILLFDEDKGLREDFELTVLHRTIDFKTQRLAIIGV
ncbi:MAG: nucleotidyltransferase domain-containing protein [Nitrospirae bacterium]|nr:nucleotidyltransferase domain-containing protein [Nitrospirota bacterium]